ncbi:MAG: toxin-antitoxin system YwqK family antitoxin [Bacteroidota bacterium]
MRSYGKQVFRLAGLAGLIAFIFLPGSVRAQDGLVRTYHSNGKIESAVFYIKDVIDGAARVYYPNTQLKEEKIYVLGVLNGWIREFYENGAPKLELYVKFGKRDGIMREYYENGGIKRVCIYENGVLKDKREYGFDSSLSGPKPRLAGQTVNDTPVNEKEKKILEREMQNTDIKR